MYLQDMPDIVMANNQVSYIKLILWPAILTLAVTLARLAGELLDGPHWLFGPQAGGGFSLVGIVWLVPVFGIYFARRLAADGRGAKSRALPLQTALLGFFFVIVVALAGVRVSFTNPYLKTALLLWAPILAAALIQFLAWPALARALLVYAFAARVPVALLMFFAMLGNWGTHYDAVPQGFPEASLAFRYLWLGLLPQFVFWVGLTVLVGSLFGSAAFALKKAKPSPDSDLPDYSDPAP